MTGHWPYGRAWLFLEDINLSSPSLSGECFKWGQHFPSTPISGRSQCLCWTISSIGLMYNLHPQSGGNRNLRSSGELLLCWTGPLRCTWSKALAVALQLLHAGGWWGRVDGTFSPGWEEDAGLGFGRSPRDTFLHSGQLWVQCFAKMQSMIESDSLSESLFLLKHIRNVAPTAVLGCRALQLNFLL